MITAPFCSVPSVGAVTEDVLRRGEQPRQGVGIRRRKRLYRRPRFFEEGFDGAPEHTDPTVMLNGVYEYHDIIYNWRRPGFPGRTQVITRQANPLDVTVYLDGERRR